MASRSTFVPPPSRTISSPIPQPSCRARPPEFIAQAIARWERLPDKQINVTFMRNNLGMLARYNRRVVEQCYKRVYCSVKDCLVLPESRLCRSYRHLAAIGQSVQQACGPPIN